MNNSLKFVLELYTAYSLIPMAIGILVGLFCKMGWEVSFYLGGLCLLAHFWATTLELSVHKDYEGDDFDV